MSTKTGKFMVAVLVDWKYPQFVNGAWKEIKKVFKKCFNSKQMVKNKINSFMVIEAELITLPSLETRKEVEDKVKKILKKFTDKINDSHHKELKRQGTIEKVYEKELTALNHDELFLEYKRLTDSVFHKIEGEIENTANLGSVLIWDLPGYTENRIILPELVATFSEFPENVESLTDMVDELLIANFARRFLPVSHDIIVDVREQFEMLAEFLDNVGRETKIPNDFRLSLQNFIGVISGVQETIKLFHREIEMSFRIATVAFKLIQTLPSDALVEWAKIKDPNIGPHIIEHTKALQDLIVSIKENLRLLNTGSEKMDDSKLSDFAKILVDTDVKSNGLLLWTHRFHQLPSFTTLEGGIAYEEVEGETYRPSSSKAIIETTKLFKTFTRGGSTIYALRGINICIESGEFIIIRGPSGAGKTTLLNMIAGLDNPGRGAVFYEGTDLVEMKDRRKSKLRRDHFSFIFQSYALIPHLNAFENVKLPLDLAGLSVELENGIQGLLDDVGIGQFAKHKPALLSGGQMQRLGIARALAGRPKILFADEPTGDLDQKTGMQVMDLLKKYHKETNVTIILVTHDEKVASYGSREIFLMDGQVTNTLD